MVREIVELKEKDRLTKDETRDLVINYLNNNYEDRFTTLSGDYSFDSNDEMFFFSDHYQDTFRVVLFMKKVDGGKALEIEYLDTYFRLNMRPEAELYFSSVVEDIMDDARVKVDIKQNERPYGLDVHSNFMDYKKLGGSRYFNIIIRSKHAGDEEKRDMFLNRLVNDNFYASVKFIDETDKREYKYVIDSYLDIHSLNCEIKK